MVGLIQSVLFKMVEQMAGAEAVADIRRRAEIAPSREFRMDEAYDDAEFRRILDCACSRLGVTRREAEKAYASFFLKDALQRWPMWFKISKSAREMLRRQPAIHNGFASGLADESQRSAVLDKFEFEDEGDELVIHYKSPNDLCGLCVDLAQEVVNHYGETATIREPRCMRRGDDACEIRIRWTVNRKEKLL